MAENESLTDWADEEDREHRRPVTVPHVPVIPRKDFIRDFGREYHAGMHVTFLGPSGRGKTFLAAQCLKSAITHHPEIEALVLHGKIAGRDDTILKMSKDANLPITDVYPPTAYNAKVRYRKRRGWIIRPLKHTEETPELENEKIAKHFRKAIHKGYNSSRKKPVIVVVDEAHQAHNDLKLRKNLEGPLMRGRPVCGVWSIVQRGRHVSYMVYDQAEWVFIFYDPDRDNQRRYSEIGGVDPRVLIELSRRLKTQTAKDGSTISQCLAFRRSGDKLVIVDT